MLHLYLVKIKYCLNGNPNELVSDLLTKDGTCCDRLKRHKILKLKKMDG